MNSLTKTFAYGSGLLTVVFLSSLSACSSTDAAGTAGAGGDQATGGSAGAPASGGNAGSSTAGSSTAGASAAESGAAGASDGASGGSIGAAGAGLGAAGAETEGGAAGAEPGAAGAGNQDGTPDDGAIAKFCNEVGFGTQDAPMDITLRLEVGTAPNIVTFSALTGTCVPLVGLACTTIPTGTDVPVRLIDPASNDAVLDTATLPVVAGKSYVLYADVENQNPTINGGSLAEGLSCPSFLYTSLP